MRKTASAIRIKKNGIKVRRVTLWLPVAVQEFISNKARLQSQSFGVPITQADIVSQNVYNESPEVEKEVYKVYG